MSITIISLFYSKLFLHILFFSTPASTIVHYRQLASVNLMQTTSKLIANINPTISILRGGLRSKCLWDTARVRELYHVRHYVQGAALSDLLCIMNRLKSIFSHSLWPTVWNLVVLVIVPKPSNKYFILQN